MASSNQTGTLKYWLNGQPVGIIRKVVGNDNKYWLNGQPITYILPGGEKITTWIGFSGSTFIG